MTEKLEYDAQLGGAVVLPDHVPTYRYAAAAVQETRQLLEQVSKPAAGGGKLIFQTLPKHLRRRAMSHNPKRLPRKYRRIYIAQMKKSGAQKVSKRPPRKYRRRPKNLMREYLRRQRRHVWLETHIWHARRFHMIERWGYRLPHYSCDKMFRACYRACADHCLVQDISYYACIELQGTVSCIYDGLCRLSHEALTINGCLTIKANTFLTGQREGCLDLFRDNEYPGGALCRALFMWRALGEEINGDTYDMERKRTLWLWVHACAYKDTISELIKVFDVKAAVADEITANSAEIEAAIAEEHKSVSKQLHLEIINKAAARTRGRIYKNDGTNVTLTDLKDAMCRFRLTGPLSQSVLTSALAPKGLMTSQASASKVAEKTDWFQSLTLESTEFQAQHQAQAQFWSACQCLDSPVGVIPNYVLGLNVIDPRLRRPIKRTKAKPAMPDSSTEEIDPMQFLVNIPKSLSNSSIWDADTRQRVRQDMMDTHTWCQMREKHALVPGGDCSFEAEMQPMPLLLIQRPGLQQKNMRLNYGCGWDLIVPAGYGLPLWLTLIMWGAKPGGLRESESLSREMGCELHLPDTIGGLEAAEEAYNEQHKKYFKLPQGKRSNYTKLAIASPFRVPWLQLLRDWSTNTKVAHDENNKFYVLRERTQLLQLNEMVCAPAKQSQHHTIELDDRAVIQLRLRMTNHGVIGVNALICLPSYIDVKKHLKRRRNSTNEPIHMEPHPTDLNQQERKHLRKQHKSQLKRLRRQRYREKKKQQETSSKRITIRPANTAALVAAHAMKMQKLWLPNEDCESLYSVRKQCSRETVGYVTTAGFALTVGTVCAIGYVTANGLKELLNMRRKLLLPQPMCLVRDINSPQFYFATFDVPINP